MERTIEVTGISDEFLACLDQRVREIAVRRNVFRKLLERAVAPPSSAATIADY